MNIQSLIQVGDTTIVMSPARYARLLNDEIIATVERRKFVQQRNAVVSYALASIAAVTATLIAINGLLVH